MSYKLSIQGNHTIMEIEVDGIKKEVKLPRKSTKQMCEWVYEVEVRKIKESKNEVS